MQAQLCRQGLQHQHRSQPSRGVAGGRCQAEWGGGGAQWPCGPQHGVVRRPQAVLVWWLQPGGGTAERHVALWHVHWSVGAAAASRTAATGKVRQGEGEELRWCVCVVGWELGWGWVRWGWGRMCMCVCVGGGVGGGVVVSVVCVCGVVLRCVIVCFFVVHRMKLPHRYPCK